VDFFGWLAKDRRRAYAAVACLALVGVPLHIIIKSQGDREPPAEVVQAPVIQGPTLAGGEYDSLNDRGRLVVVVFLDIASPASADQADAFAGWRKSYADRRATFVAVLADAPAEQLAAFADAHGLPREAAVVDRGGTRHAPFHVGRGPALVVIDPTGRARFARTGFVKPDNPAFHTVMNYYLNQALRLPLPGTP
jgi:hypothetical protein